MLSKGGLFLVAQTAPSGIASTQPFPFAPSLQYWVYEQSADSLQGHLASWFLLTTWWDVLSQRVEYEPCHPSLGMQWSPISRGQAHFPFLQLPSEHSLCFKHGSLTFLLVIFQIKREERCFVTAGLLSRLTCSQLFMHANAVSQSFDRGFRPKGWPK